MTSYAGNRRRYSTVRQRGSTKALTVKLTLFAVVATIVIGGLIATQMAAGNDPALGPKAAARAKKKAAGNTSNNGSSASSGSGTQVDPYGQGYGDDGYYYGYGGNYGSSSSGSSSSGSSGYTYTPPPVTSSTS